MKSMAKLFNWYVPARDKGSPHARKQVSAWKQSSASLEEMRTDQGERLARVHGFVNLGLPLVLSAGAPKRRQKAAIVDVEQHGETEDSDEEAHEPRGRNDDKWEAEHVPYSSAVAQYHAGVPSCWKRYGSSGKKMRRWQPEIPEGSDAEAFSVGYTERKCRGQGCPAGLRLLDPTPAEAAKLEAINIAPYAVFSTKQWHLHDHANWFLGPEDCREKTVLRIQTIEDAIFEELDEVTNKAWARKRALTLPKQLRESMTQQTKEPLRQSGTVRKALTRNSAASSAAGSAEAGACQSILEAEHAGTWRSRVGYSRVGACTTRTRLSRDVVDLWQPYRVRPTLFEVFRPWAFMFNFDDVEDSMTHGYAWTTIAMIRAAHHWVQANGMVNQRVARFFVCFDGNFDVVASKRAGRVNMPDEEGAHESGTASVHVLHEWPDEGEVELPADSEDEGPKPQRPQMNQWVSVIISTDRKKYVDNVLVSSGVPLCLLVCRSENRDIIVKTVQTWLELVVAEYPQEYTEIRVCYARADNGSATRAAAVSLVATAPPEERHGPAGCYVHEMLKCAEGKSTWEAQFGQLRRKFKTAAVAAAMGDFNTTYTEWMRRAHRCPTLALLQRYGELLAKYASSIGAARSAGAFRLKFGNKRLPFHSSASGLPGVVAHNQSIESLHAFFDRAIFGRGLLSHKAYHEAVTQNSSSLASVVPAQPTEMRVTAMPPTTRMIEKAQTHMHGGWVGNHDGYLLFRSGTIPMAPRGAAPELAAKWDADLIMRTTLQGLKGDFSAMDACLSLGEADNAAAYLEIFESFYLSMHAVKDGSCSCPEYWGSSVCWHVAFRQLVGAQGVSLGVRLGSFPVPGELARLYLGIGKPKRTTHSRPTMQDTPPRRQKLASKQHDSAGHQPASSMAASSSGAGEPGASAQGSGGSDRSGGSASAPRTFYALEPYAKRGTLIASVEYLTPGGLLQSFASACKRSRTQGCEHVAFLLGGVVGELSEPTDVRIQITH